MTDYFRYWKICIFLLHRKVYTTVLPQFYLITIISHHICGQSHHLFLATLRRFYQANLPQKWKKLKCELQISIDMQVS